MMHFLSTWVEFENAVVAREHLYSCAQYSAHRWWLWIYESSSHTNVAQLDHILYQSRSQVDVDWLYINKKRKISHHKSINHCGNNECCLRWSTWHCILQYRINGSQINDKKIILSKWSFFWSPRSPINEQHQHVPSISNWHCLFVS